MVKLIAQLIAQLCLYGALFILVLELLARTEDSVRFDAPFWGHYHLEGIRGVDDRGTRRCAANTRYKHFRLGEHGFRETLTKQAGAQTFVWLGASEAFGLYETPGEDVANQLERNLDRKGRDVDVVNAACFGLNVARMQRLLEDPLPDVAMDYLALYPTPHFYLDAHLVGEDQPVAASPAKPRFVSRLVTKGRDVMKTFLPAALQDYMRALQTQQAIETAREDWLWQQPPADRLALFEAQMRTMLDAATALDARVAVLTHANAFHRQTELDKSKLQAWQKFYPRAAGEVLIEFDRAANAITRRLAAEYQVELIDMAEVVQGEPGLFADFSHFTDAGATLAANRLQQWVESAR